VYDHCAPFLDGREDWAYAAKTLRTFSMTHGRAGENIGEAVKMRQFAPEPP
jgi:hypothetical protein